MASDLGQVAEWFKALDSKSSVPSKGTVGSTPTLSALCRWLQNRKWLQIGYTPGPNMPAICSGWLRSGFYRLAVLPWLQRPGVALVTLQQRTVYLFAGIADRAA